MSPLNALTTAPAPLLVVDASDRVIEASAAFASGYALAPGDLLNRRLAELAPPLDGLREAAARARGAGAVVRLGAAGGGLQGTAVPLGEGHVLLAVAPAAAAPGGLDAAEILASISDAFFALDRDWCFTYVNEQAEPLLERAPEDLVGKNLWEEFPEAVGTPFWDAYHQAVETGELVQIDAFFEPLGRHFAVRAYPFADGLSVYFADVTARKWAEDAIRESDERYRLLVEAIDQGFCIIEMLWDDDGRPVDYRYVETNSAFEAQAGFAPEGRTIREIAPDLEQHWFDTFGAVARTGEPARIEGRADALGRWYDAYATRIGGDESDRVALLFSDVTRRKRTEAALQASEARYRFLGESLQQQIWTAEPDGQLDYVNRYVTDYFGRSAHEVIGAGWQAVVHPDDLPTVAERWGHALQTGEPYRTEFRLLRAQDQSYRWHLARADALVEDGRVVKWFGANVDVHEQKEAEAALRASEARARLALDAARLGLWSLDPATSAGTQDARTQEIMGLDPAEQATLGDAFELIHPDDLAAVQALLAAALDPAGEGRLEGELRVLGPTLRWVRMTARTTFEGDGDRRQPVEVVGTLADITAQKESERELLAVIDGLPELAWSAGPDGAIDFYNERWYAYTGTTLDEMQGWGWAAVHDPAILSEVTERWGRSLDTGEPFEMAFPLRRADGVFRWFLTRATPVRDAEGQIVRWIGTNTDITEHQRLLGERDAALGQLRQSEERHRLALEGGGMGTWEWHISGDRLESDARAHRLWGTEPGEVESVAAFYDRIVHPDDLPELQAEVARVLADGDDYASEFRVVRPDGRIRWTANRGRIVRDAEGAPVRMFGLSYDVTERREAEEALRRKNAEMEQFAYTISHDLKSPLVTITGFLGLLKGQVQAGQTDRALASADRVLGAADRMGRLIEDLLHLSRAGRVTGDPAPVDLDALVGGLADGLGQRVRQAGGALDVEVPLGRLLADEQRLGEVIENLLANAVTYGLGGGGTRITVSSERMRGGGLRLVVEDDGPGVPPAYRRKVFELFQRLDGGGDGTGIGLALVARIMEVTGGHAHVESADGPPGHEGARFVLEFPASAVLERPPDARAKTAPAATEPPPARSDPGSAPAP